MGTQLRKERERAERHQRIIDTARELAEAEGWEAVTIRKLAERIEYSQPVLYSHFANKAAIVGAVALQGCIELAEEVRLARESATSRTDMFDKVARAYLDFAVANPARYDAIFVLTTDLTFGLDAPQPLRDAFAGLEAMFRSGAEGDELGARTEVAWAGLHGIATLERSDRLRPELRERRIALLVESWAAFA
ncbi:TetR family transcriptional regulator [Nocardia neocaledoniensis NBRC 108232]|uniref:TetR family transcriptional regulator n=1 Tax=Nocardia neocaledoniensis TaxID=236511 RepID=A0A317NWQ2_9NOCA|nr:TetR/AcrR family transcriptional regulator [Nocardia neocaledoniensis]PWV79363.1 TetR family transcriptional regulator [Nocardia neocaledoniensis]GEM33371.1 TetR family transcriptional regulator [Nocardia neocaledoniensis NBRC 108232]